MTDLLKTLLHKYGILYVSLSKLASERPGNPYESLNAYYEAIGIPHETSGRALRETFAALDPGEPAVVVRISSDGSARIGSLENQGNGACLEGECAPRIAVWELPRR